MAVEVKLNNSWVSFHDLVESKVSTCQSLRVASQRAGISPSTMSRITAAKKEPDIETFGRLWEWLGLRIEGVRMVEPR